MPDAGKKKGGIEWAHKNTGTRSTHAHVYTPAASYVHRGMFAHIYPEPVCYDSEGGAAGVKAPVAVVSCHHLEEYMSPCLHSQQHKLPPNNWVSEDQRAPVHSSVWFFFPTRVRTASTDTTQTQNVTLS